MAEKVFEYDPATDPAYTKPCVSLTSLAELRKITSTRKFHSTGDEEDNGLYDRYARLKGDINVLQQRLYLLDKLRTGTEISTTASTAADLKNVTRQFAGISTQSVLANYLENDQKMDSQGLGAVSVISRAAALNNTKGQGASHELFYLPSNNPELVAANRRIANLEQAVGENTAVAASPAAPLQEQVVELLNKLALLSDHKLNHMLSRVKTLGSEFDGFELPEELTRKRVSVVEREMQAQEDSAGRQEQVEKQFQKIEELPSYTKVCQIAARLQTQQDLHARSARVVERIRKLREQQDGCIALLKRDFTALKMAEASVQTNLAVMKNNSEVLKSKIKK